MEEILPNIDSDRWSLVGSLVSLVKVYDEKEQVEQKEIQTEHANAKKEHPGIKVCRQG